MTISRPAVAIHIFEIDRSADIPASVGRSNVATISIACRARAGSQCERSPVVIGIRHGPSR